MNSKPSPKINKAVVIDWEEYRKALLEDTYVDDNISAVDLIKHRTKLEEDPIEWIYFFFPGFAKYAFAPFHKKFIHRCVNNMEWYEVISWSRELAKSTTVMFVVLYLVLTGKKKNIIMTSNSYDNAVRLLEPYRANLDTNPRIKAYYGEQVMLGFWEAGEFKTKGGASFRALGAGQSPRGTRSGALRVDTLLVDDFDTDEECRNPETIKKKWNWFEQALYFTRSMSEPLLTIWCGNIIAKDCCITRAGKKARELAQRPKPIGNWDIINIRMVNPNRPDPKNDFLRGKSVWPQKNSEEKIEEVLAQVSTGSAQKECFNNPVSEGEIFKDLTWGKCPPLNTLRFAVVYADPSTSNKDRATKGTSFKSAFLIGYKDSKYYIYKGFLEQTGNDNFIGWLYDLRNFGKERTQLYFYIENNSLQDPFYEQVFIPLFAKYAKTHGTLPIMPDTRRKPDKYARIEGNLEPLNRAGNLVFNEDEAGNPHMQRLAEQFELINPQLSAPADGPDCIEGGVYIINGKNGSIAAGAMQFGTRKKNSKRV